MQYVKKRSGEIPNPIWLKINISVLFENRSLYCNQVTNKNHAKHYDIKQIQELIDLQSLDNPVRKSELLVANRINYTKIKGVYNR